MHYLTLLWCIIIVQSFLSASQPIVNVALCRPATQSSTYLQPYGTSAGNSVDGNIDSVFNQVKHSLILYLSSVFNWFRMSFFISPVYSIDSGCHSLFLQCIQLIQDVILYFSSVFNRFRMSFFIYPVYIIDSGCHSLSPLYSIDSGCHSLFFQCIQLI